MDKVIYFVNEAIDTHSREEMATSILWRTLQNHCMMDEYIMYGIENHPSISLERVKKLITNSASRNSSRGDKLEELEARVSEVEKVATGTKLGTRISSKSLDNLKKRVKKLEKKT